MFVSFLFVMVSAEGLRRERVITGDPMPPAYPVVNVHISEPTLGTSEFNSAAVAHQHEQDSLLKLEKHVAFLEEQTLATIADLAQHVQIVGDLVGSSTQA